MCHLNKRAYKKEDIYLPFSYDIYHRDLIQYKNDLYMIYNEQKFTFIYEQFSRARAL
jgi:hypothetical protein